MMRNQTFGMGCALALVVYAILVIWRLESFSWIFELMLRSLVSILIFCVGIISGIKMLAKRKFRNATISFLFCLVPIAATMTSGRVFGQKMDETFIRADSVIVALNKYYSDSGNFPSSLEKLVPKYISSVPVTAMGVVSSHEFFYKKESIEYRLAFEATDGIYCRFTPGNDWLCDD